CREPTTCVALSGLSGLDRIELLDDALNVGALASIAQLEQAARDALPEYARVLYYFGSPPIKNAGTIGGNIANASPIGDSMPAMYVLNAEVELVNGAGATRRVNINDFYTGYKKSVMAADELIARVMIPIPAA